LVMYALPRMWSVYTDGRMDSMIIGSRGQTVRAVSCIVSDALAPAGAVHSRFREGDPVPREARFFYLPDIPIYVIQRADNWRPVSLRRKFPDLPPLLRGRIESNTAPRTDLPVAGRPCVRAGL